MKTILTAVVFTLLFSFSAFSQIKGDIVKDNREITNNPGFIIQGHLTGKMTIEFSVNAKGEISSSKVIDSESTIKSTPAKIKIMNHVAKFEFEPGTWFPKFHQGTVIITMVKPN